MFTLISAAAIGFILLSLVADEALSVSISATQNYDLVPKLDSSSCQSTTGADEYSLNKLFDAGDGYLSMLTFTPLANCPSKGKLSGILWGSFLFESSINIPDDCIVDVTVYGYKLLVHYRCKQQTDSFCLPKCTFAYSNAPCMNPPSNTLPYPYDPPSRINGGNSGVLYTLQICSEPCPTLAPSYAPTSSPTYYEGSQTMEPTSTPTSIPSVAPTINIIPTTAPTRRHRPTSEPTSEPSSLPTEGFYIRVPHPTNVPTSVPTSIPTNA